MLTSFLQLLLIVSPPKLLCVLDPLYMQAVKLEKIRSNSKCMSNRVEQNRDLTFRKQMSTVVVK